MFVHVCSSKRCHFIQQQEKHQRKPNLITIASVFAFLLHVLCGYFWSLPLLVGTRITQTLPSGPMTWDSGCVWASVLMLHPSFLVPSSFSACLSDTSRLSALKRGSLLFPEPVSFLSHFFFFASCIICHSSGSTDHFLLPLFLCGTYACYPQLEILVSQTELGKASRRLLKDSETLVSVTILRQ